MVPAALQPHFKHNSFNKVTYKYDQVLLSEDYLPENQVINEFNKVADYKTIYKTNSFPVLPQWLENNVKKKPSFKIAIKVSNTKNKVNKKHVGSIRKYLIF